MQVPIVRASLRHGITTESSGVTLSPSPAAGVVLGSTPARIGEIVAFAPGARVSLEEGISLSVTTREAFPNEVKKLTSLFKDLRNDPAAAAALGAAGYLTTTSAHESHRRVGRQRLAPTQSLASE
jgi:hypothetical protein